MRQRGFTLIELLVYVSIIGSLLLAVTYFFGVTAESRVKNQSISEVNQQGQAAMELITQAVRNADSITLPAAAASGAQLSLTVPSAANNPTIFSLSGSVLQSKEGTAAAIPLTNGKVQMTSLTFRNLTRSGTPGTVQISFVLSRLNPSATNAYDYQRTFTSTASVRP